MTMSELQIGDHVLVGKELFFLQKNFKGHKSFFVGPFDTPVLELW